MPTKAFEEACDLRELYPDLTDEQLKDVEETLRNYIRIAWRIFEQPGLEQPTRFDGVAKPL